MFGHLDIFHTFQDTFSQNSHLDTLNQIIIKFWSSIKNFFEVSQNRTKQNDFSTPKQRVYLISQNMHSFDYFELFFLSHCPKIVNESYSSLKCIDKISASIVLLFDKQYNSLITYCT